MSCVPEFRTGYLAYLEKFGDRCLEELKLESPTLHDDPLLLLRSIGQLARRLTTSGTPPAGDEAGMRRRAEGRVRRAFDLHPVRAWSFGGVLRNARARVRDRENLRSSAPGCSAACG